MLAVTATLLLIAAQPDAAAEPVPGPIEISRAWTPAPEKPGGDTALYVTIANDGDVADNLIRTKCGFVDFTELATVDSGGEGSPSTRTVKAIPIPPHQTVTLKPDGYHVTLLHTIQPLQPGEIVGCAVKFQKSGERLVEVTVAPPGAQTAP